MSFSKVFKCGVDEGKFLRSYLLSNGLNRENVWQYLSLRYCIGPKTLIDGVSKRILLDEPRVKKSSDTLDSILLDQKPKGKFGVLLSGGVDSGILAKLYDGSETTFVFVQTLLGTERPYFDKIAETLKGKIEVVNLSRDTYIDYTRDICSKIDEPVGDAAVVSVFAGSKRLKELGVNTVVVGEGGDEQFGGYWGYVNFEETRRKGEKLNFQIVKNHIGMAFNQDIQEVRDYWKDDKFSGDLVLQAMWWDRFKGLDNLFIWKNIRGAELAGCNCVIPYAHSKVWDFATKKLTSKDRVDLDNPLKKKIWLKKFAMDLGVPEFCVDREKMGFRSEGDSGVLDVLCSEMGWKGKSNSEIFAAYSLWKWCDEVGTIDINEIIMTGRG